MFLRFFPIARQRLPHAPAALCLPLALMTGPAAGSMGIIMPIYGNTDSQFNAAEAAARRVPLIAVFNPSNGPGSSKRSSYANAVARIQAAGGQVVGYISTAYTGTALSDVKSQMDSYSSWYRVNGYFLDEMTTSTSSTPLNYYKSAKSYASGKGKFIVGNPGTSISSSYLNAAQILITYEHYSGWGGASAGSPPDRYGAIPYNVGSLGSMITQASSKGYGWIYVTNRSEPDPFGAVPSYWSAEVDAVEKINLPPLPPAIAADKFHVSKAEISPAGGIAVTFPVAARRRYAVQVSTNLVDWTTAGSAADPAVPLAITATADGSTTLTAARLPGTQGAYYRAIDLDSIPTP